MAQNYQLIILKVINLLMSKQISETKSTKKSWGFPSEKEIDDWSNEGKRKSTLFIKSSIKNNPQKAHKARKYVNNEEEMQLAFNTSINQLREETKSQKSISSTISNRMSYFEVDLKRKQQRMEIAKNKYHKMIQVRHKSFIEKKELYKEREESAFNYSESARLKASRIKSERKNSQISVQILRERNHVDAMKLKDAKFKNQQLIAQRQMIEIQKKRQIVQKSHQYAQVSKQKLHTLQNQKHESAKAMHKFKMLQQFSKSEMQRRKNTKLMGHFMEKVKKMQQQTKKITRQLTEYEQMLGRQFSNRKAKQSITSNTLYVTS